jgi:hypothetical protein
LTLTLGGHFSKDMAFVGVLVFVTSRGLFKALRSATVNFSFWHNKTPVGIGRFCGSFCLNTYCDVFIFKVIRQLKSPITFSF